MFGFQGGEGVETLARKKSYMNGVQHRWAYLTNFDVSTIKNEIQLRTMIKDRSSIS
jgi:hypothetical protein